MPARDGTIPPEVSRGFDEGVFNLPATPALGTSLAGSTWKIPVILVDFTNQPLTYTSQADWSRALFDTTHSTATGSVFDYYTWVSGRRLRVVGTVVATVHLSHPKEFYADYSWGSGSGAPSSYGAADEAMRACSSQVDWSEFDRDLDGYVDMLWVVHSGLGGEHVITGQDLWSVTSTFTQWGGSSVFVTTDLVPGTNVFERVDAFSILPEMSAFQIGQPSEIGVFCHEFGHALGLPDLYNTHPFEGTRGVGPGNWSLMSTGAYGGDGLSPAYPAHIGAWPAIFLGWTSTVRPAEDGPLALGPIENGGNVLELWFQGEPSSEHFLVENRQRQGFDRNLPADGLIVYWVDDFAIRALVPANQVISDFYTAFRLIEADGQRDLDLGLNHGDPFDPMPGSSGRTLWDDTTYPNTRSQSGNVTYVALRDITAAGDSMHFQVQVRAPGWQAAQTVSGPGFLPVLASGRGERSALLPDSSLAVVGSEYVAGRPQVVLRIRRPNHVWEPSVQVSASSGAATEPTLSALPGGDLCVAWSDSRHGASELYYRSRVLGVWTGERRLTDLPGYSLSPALGADARGGVHVAWHYTDSNGAWIYFMYFPYLTPVAEPRPVTSAGRRPEPPALAIGRDGSSYILWADRAAPATSLWFAHFAPDSGLRPANALTQTVSGIQPGVAAAVASDGALHFLWQTGGGGGNQIHYQVRDNRTSQDMVLVQRSESIQNFAILLAPDGGRHVIIEATASGSAQILYKEWRASGGWDVGSTEVTRAGGVTATRPMYLPLHPGAGSVLYVAYTATGAALLERDRGEWQQPLAAVPEGTPRGAAGFRLGPNPLRAGGVLSLRFDGPAPAERRLDLFDLAGRRVAATELRPTGGGWSAEIPASVTSTWPNGVYFARAAGGRVGARIVVTR